MKLTRARTVCLLLAIVHALLAWNSAAGPLAGKRVALASLIVTGVFVALAVLCTAALVMPARAAPKLAALVISTSLGLAGVETLVRHYGRYRPLHLPPSYDRRARSEVIADLRDDGVEAVPNFIPGRFLRRTPSIGGVPTIPLGGIGQVPVVHCNYNESGYYARYESDEHGFNNPFGIWGRESFEIALIGDSFTHGACVDVRYADLIRERHPGTLNLGSDGCGPLLELAALKEYLPAARPELVLWFYYEGNDHKELNKEKRSELLMAYLESDFVQGLRERQDEIDAYLTGIVERRARRQRDPLPAPILARVWDEELRWLPRLRLSVTQLHLANLWRPPAKVHALDSRLFERILRDARITVESWGGELVFVYLVSYDTIQTGVSHPWREVVLSIAGGLGLPVVDIERAFREHPDGLSLFPFRLPGHYTEEGNRVVAEAVLVAIDGG